MLKIKNPVIEMKNVFDSIDRTKVKMTNLKVGQQKLLKLKCKEGKKNKKTVEHPRTVGQV